VTSVDALTHFTCASHVDLPQVDETLKGGTAASQGGYLLKSSPPSSATEPGEQFVIDPNVLGLCRSANWLHESRPTGTVGRSRQKLGSIREVVGSIVSGMPTMPITSEIDSDLRWLRNYGPGTSAPPLQQWQVDRLKAFLYQLIKSDRLPFTVGLFGGWGSGKTTFLSILANNIIADTKVGYKIIYFNAWKYAGFLEIVPSLIYKVLKYGNHADKDPGEAIKEIMVSLGKEYSDAFGDWAEKKVGINVAKLFKDASKVYSNISEGAAVVPKDVLDAYYTQIDRAQDLLDRVFSDRSKVTIVLIDELDRCDPDEAFSVIKQLRVFFAMRNLPIAFVICANPDPIGLAIKHKYGLSTASGDYEARRILEKFVDIYIDMSEPIELGEFVTWLWHEDNKSIEDYASLIFLDDTYVVSDRDIDVTKNSTALQAMSTDNPLYSNLRLLRKTFERVCSRDFANEHLLWTAWHLELTKQMDPTFRAEIGKASSDIVAISASAYDRILRAPIRWRDGKLDSSANPDGTLFGGYRSGFWDACKARRVENLKNPDPEAQERAEILARWMADFRRMDFLSILTLLPLENAGDLKNVARPPDLSLFLSRVEFTKHQMGYLLANY
jgi:KAP family P-loop domain